MTNELNLINNLIYQVFGSAWIFGIVMSIFFAWYSIKYNIPKEASIAFAAIFWIYLGALILDTWIIFIIGIVFTILLWAAIPKIVSG